MSQACNEFSRAHLLRNAVARAGSGLPAIEPGAPAPAGTGMDRRAFMLSSAGLALTLYGAGSAASSSLFEGIAEAAAAPPSQPVVVSICASGGWDALNMLCPATDNVYRSSRSALRMPVDASLNWSEDPRLQWHPSLAPLKTLHNEGKVTVMPGLGYSAPNQSHFTSRHFYDVGELDPFGRTGWAGRYLDQHGSDTNPLQGLSLDRVLAPELATDRKPVAALIKPADFTFAAPGVTTNRQNAMFDAFAALGNGNEADPAMTYARGAIRATSTVKTQMAPFTSVTSPVTYPNTTFGAQLKALGAMLGQNMPIKYVSINAPGGYDSHANQDAGPAALAPNLDNTSAGVLAFQRDLEARGLADRVLIWMWSEFGRRVKENGSNGTDHGEGGIGFLIGTRAKGTMIGEWPGLNTLHDGSLRHTSDYRAIYCSILEQWYGVDATPIIPNATSFTRPQLLK